VTEPTNKPLGLPSRDIIQNLVGLQIFNTVALLLSSLVLSLGKLAAYAAGESEYFVYSASAMVISQSLVVVLLLIAGKLLQRTSQGSTQNAIVVITITFAHVFGTFLFEEILRSWNFEPIQQSLTQRAISLLFTFVIYMGFGWVTFVLNRNFNQVNLGKEMLTALSDQQLALTIAIRDARTFAIREISLEIQSTRGSLETYVAATNPDHETAQVVNELEKTLDDVEIQVNKISNRFPGSPRPSKAQPKVKQSTSAFFSASTLPNYLLPKLIAVFAFFGFSSWLSYFIPDLTAIFIGFTLSGVSFVIFWIYEKYAVSKMLSKPVFVRIFVYQLLVFTYLFFWLFILGFLAGDNSVSYTAALAYTAIPFIFFNAGAALSGVIASTDDYRELLTKQATELRHNLASLDQIRVDEDKVWKSLFAGDIALSPTTASVILRDAILAKDLDRVVTTIPNVYSLWKSVLVKLPNPR